MAAQIGAIWHHHDNRQYIDTPIHYGFRSPIFKSVHAMHVLLYIPIMYFI